MRKDRFGICLTFYAVLAFVLAILGQTLLGGLLLGFAILVQQDEWLTRQTMQAFFISLLSGIVNTFIGVVSPLYSVPFLGGVLSGIFGFITSLISLAIIIVSFIGLFKVAKEQDAGVPLCKGFADKAFGLIKTVSYSQPTQTPPASGSQDPQNS